MKIAHLILAHKNPAQLQKLLSALEHPHMDFFIHVDKKADESQFRALARQRGVHFVSNRVNVRWGCYSLVQAQLNGMKEILDSGGYDFINVLSAQDFPLRSASEIFGFFSANKGTEFISQVTYQDDPVWWDQAMHRVKQYNFQNWRLPGKYRLQFLVNRLTPPRKFPLPYTLAGRSQWFSITTGCARYIIDFLEQHPQVVRFFKYVWGADEFIFSTIVYNSAYRERSNDNLMYTDWSEGKPNPKLLTVSDFDRLVQSGKLFARKFDIAVDADIFTMLEEWVKERKLVH